MDDGLGSLWCAHGTLADSYATRGRLHGLLSNGSLWPNGSGSLRVNARLLARSGAAHHRPYAIFASRLPSPRITGFTPRVSLWALNGFSNLPARAWHAALGNVFPRRLWPAPSLWLWVLIWSPATGGVWSSRSTRYAGSALCPGCPSNGCP
ncbi:MAG: hypothetical protein ACKO63_14195 [Nodosilinea sp.]